MEEDLINRNNNIGMATNNPQANVNQFANNQSMQSSQNTMSTNNQINPITIPIQIQPQVAQPMQPQINQINQMPTTAPQVNQNLQTQPTQNNPNGINQINSSYGNIGFDQIYDSYKQATGATGNTQNNDASSSGVKRTSFNTTVVTPTTSNLNTVEGQYQSAYADTVNGLIGSMLEQLNSLKDGSFYDPTQDNALRLATEYAANSTLQSLAGSGVLNSTATSERIARIVSELIPQYENLAYERQLNYLNQLANTAQLVMGFDAQQFEYWKDAKDREFQNKQFEYQKQQDALANAWKRVDELGYVDNEASTVLGVPAGTLSGEARLAKEQREFELQKMREQLEIERANEEALARLKSELDLQSNKTLADYESQLNKQEMDYQAQLNRQNAQLQSELEKQQLSYKSQLSREEAQLQSQLNKQETENNYKLQQQYEKTSNSKTDTVGLSTYRDIINNRYTTYDDITGTRTVSDNVGLYYYLYSELQNGRLSENDLKSLIALYNITVPTQQEKAQYERRQYLQSLRKWR